MKQTPETLMLKLQCPDAAAEWYQKAADQGCKEAIQALDEIGY